jgi:hypothetical protein
MRRTMNIQTKSKAQLNLDLLTQERQRQLKALKTQLIKAPYSSSLPSEEGSNPVIENLSRLFPPLRLFQFKDTVHPKDSLGKGIEHYQILFPSERVKFGVNEIDREFLKICLYYDTDYFDRSEIFICDVVPAYIHVGLGIVCTQDFRAIVDSGMQYRVTIARWRISILHRLKLLWAKQLSIKVVYVFSLSGENFWHFLYDCIPRIYSAMIARPDDEKLTVLVPDNLPNAFRDLLACILPENFDTIYVPIGSWVKVNHLVMPSYVSRCENGFLPNEYYEYIRRCVFKQYELSPVENPIERIYISRSQAKHRRILNEDKVIDCLTNYGFRAVVLEALSLREQVEVFTKAEVIVSPHGAGLATTLFSGKIKILVLYPESHPTPFFFTQFKGLGQEHYFIVHDQFDENADFEVDLSELKRVLHEQMNLKPKQTD